MGNREIRLGEKVKPTTKQINMKKEQTNWEDKYTKWRRYFSEKSQHLSQQNLTPDTDSVVLDYVDLRISQEREKWLKELADDFDFRCELANAVMEQYNKVPKTGSFYFDGISSQEVMWQVIEKINLLQK